MRLEGCVERRSKDRGGEGRGCFTLGGCLEKTCEDKCKVVAWVKAMPESTGDKSRHARSKARFLPLGCDSQVYVVPQPVVGVHVPALEIAARVLRSLDAPSAHILQSIPLDASRFWINTLVTQTGQDACSLGKGPDAVVLEARGEAKHVKQPNPAEKAVLEIGISGDEVWGVQG